MALFGARFCGKRYFARRLLEDARRSPGCRLLEVHFLTDNRVTTILDLKQLLSRPITFVLGATDWRPCKRP